MKHLLSALLLFAFFNATAQQHGQSHQYVYPTDKQVQKKLSEWQDLKFGLMMHWGTYSQWGIVESWSICPEDEGWTQRTGPHAASYNEYVQAYENLQQTFNPRKFDPAKWADAAADAGMKYVVFTTKHHDGFCMFDTKETDYKITDPKTPFAANPKSNIAREIFSSFRNKGLLTGAYFSKPDWHNKDYWWPYFPPKSRNVNYDPAKYPERWNAYKKFTFNQIRELMSDYGKMDILWLDGGWVRPYSSIDTAVEWQRTIPYNQDIDMPGIAAMARTLQPGLLVVDRTVAGEFENYQTPEQTVPATPLDYPWESCITMGNSWSYVPNDKYKSANEIIHLLIRIVSRGGNLLLNVGPSPEGEWSDTVFQRMQEIGNWLKINGTGIYGSKPLPPYEKENFVYTSSKDGKSKFIFVMSNPETEHVAFPDEIEIAPDWVNPKTKISVAGSTVKPRISTRDGKTFLQFPKKITGKENGRHALMITLLN